MAPSQPIKLKLKLGGTSTTNGVATAIAKDVDSTADDDWDEDDLLHSIDNDQSNVAGPSNILTPITKRRRKKEVDVAAGTVAAGSPGGSKLKLKLNLGSRSTSTKHPDDQQEAHTQPALNATSTPTPKIKFNVRSSSAATPQDAQPKEDDESMNTPSKPSKKKPTTKGKQNKEELDDNAPAVGTSTPRIKVKLSSSAGSTAALSKDDQLDGELGDGQAGDAVLKTPVGGVSRARGKNAATPSTMAPPVDLASLLNSTATATDETSSSTSTSIKLPVTPSPAKSRRRPASTGKGVGTSGKKRVGSKLRQEVGVDEMDREEEMMAVGDDQQEVGVRVLQGDEAEMVVETVQEADGEPAKEEKNSSDIKQESEAVATDVGETAEGIKAEEGQPDEMDQDGDDDGDDDGDNDQDQDDDNNPDSMDFDTPGRPHPAHPKRVPGGKGGGRNKKPFAFRKKPLGHLLTTIIGNLRRKDAYGLFFDPVSLEEYPNYFEVIGGEDRAMDLGTMEDKVGRGGYRSMKEFEEDVDKMITAAQTFNPDDTLVHREAAKVAQLAERQFNRFRALVKTPSPSPERETTSGFRTPADLLGESVGPTPSNRSVSPTGTNYKEALAAGTIERSAVAGLLPRQLVPEGMLDYPPNSDVARCVGWYLSGGKRLRSKKEQRAKEKWDGTWREWNVEGDKNVREADDIMAMLAEGFIFETSGHKVMLPRTVDWQDEVMNAAEKWVPTPTLTGVAADEVVPQIPYRRVDHLDVGRYQNLAGSYGFPEFKRYDARKFVRDLTVDLESGWRDEEREFGERASRVVKEMCLGEDPTSEAYARSVETFITGARIVDGADVQSKAESIYDEGVIKDELKEDDKMEIDQFDQAEKEIDPLESAEPSRYDASRFDLGIPLDEYVNEQWREGWLHAGMRGTVKRTREMYKEMTTAEPENRVKRPKLEDALEADDFDIEAVSRAVFGEYVEDAMKRVPIAFEIERYAARGNGLDLACLLHETTDFAAGGSSTGPPPSTEPGRAAWYEKSLKLAGEQVIQATKRRQTLTPAELGSEVEREKMKRLRLDLLSLTKNVPVYELRPMTTTEVEKLPMAVRGLIKVVSKP